MRFSFVSGDAVGAPRRAEAASAGAGAAAVRADARTFTRTHRGHRLHRRLLLCSAGTGAATVRADAGALAGADRRRRLHRRPREVSRSGRSRSPRRRGRGWSWSSPSPGQGRLGPPLGLISEPSPARTRLVVAIWTFQSGVSAVGVDPGARAGADAGGGLHASSFVADVAGRPLRRRAASPLRVQRGTASEGDEFGTEGDGERTSGAGA